MLYCAGVVLLAAWVGLWHTTASVNVCVFPLVIELILVPIIVVFVGLQVVAAYDPARAPVRKVVDGALATIGFILLGHAAVAAILDPSGLLTRENAETLLVARALTLAFVLLLWTWAWVSRREQENLRRRFRAGYGSTG